MELDDLEERGKMRTEEEERKMERKKRQNICLVKEEGTDRREEGGMVY
jgi:hypothetical protein